MLEINKIYNMDCLDGLKQIKDKSVDLILTDPPYNIGYKNEIWDSRGDYFDFMGQVFRECERVLKKSGSLYFFHNQFPAMSRLNDIMESKTNLTLKSFLTWHKNKFSMQHWGYPNKYKRTCFKKFFQTCEYILYYTFNFQKAKRDVIHDDADNFRDIKDYLISEKKKSKLKERELIKIIGCSTRHYFTDSQFQLISKSNYKKLQEHTKNFQKPWEELKNEYEKLKNEYENDERYIDAEPIFNYFDLEMENFIQTNLNNAKRIHPCQKPREIIDRLIRISSNKNGLVLDPFAGSGMICKTAKELGRNFLGFELNKEYYKKSMEFLKL